MSDKTEEPKNSTSVSVNYLIFNEVQVKFHSYGNCGGKTGLAYWLMQVSALVSYNAHFMCILLLNFPEIINYTETFFLHLILYFSPSKRLLEQNSMQKNPPFVMSHFPASPRDKSDSHCAEG